MNIEYKNLKPKMYEQLQKGWKLLPENAVGVGDDRESILRYLKRNRKCSFAAFDNKTMVGAVLAGHDGRRALLNHLFVLPEYRRNGIGKELVARSFKELKKQGIKRSAVFIHKTNHSAQLFWSRIGYEKIDFIETYGIDLEQKSE